MSYKVKSNTFVYIGKIRWFVLRPNKSDLSEWVLQRGAHNPKSEIQGKFEPYQIVMSTRAIEESHAESMVEGADFEIRTGYTPRAIKNLGKKFVQRSEN